VTANSRKRTTRAAWAVLIALLVILMLADAGRTLVVSRPVADPDAIISLASHEWERLPTAAQLARAYPNAMVILTIPQDPTPFNCHDCENRAARLGAMGVDRARVQVVTLSGPGTHGEAVAAAHFARSKGIERLVIVTSPYHTRRALAVFRTVFEGSGIAIGVEPALSASQARPPLWWWHADDRAYVPYEWAAIVYYLAKYGVNPII
jgi:uncharacterized SAM-binding protein YcdF (DUF218 family)